MIENLQTVHKAKDEVRRQMLTKNLEHNQLEENFATFYTNIPEPDIHIFLSPDDLICHIIGLSHNIGSIPRVSNIKPLNTTNSNTTQATQISKPLSHTELFTIVSYNLQNPFTTVQNGITAFTFNSLQALCVKKIMHHVLHKIPLVMYLGGQGLIPKL